MADGAYARALPRPPALAGVLAHGTLSAHPHSTDALSANDSAGAPSTGLWCFAETVADLLDVPLAAARTLLDRLDDPSSWAVLWPGDVDRNSGASKHAIEALPGRPDLLQLAIVQGGVVIGRQRFGPPA